MTSQTHYNRHERDHKQASTATFVELGHFRHNARLLRFLRNSSSSCQLKMAGNTCTLTCAEKRLTKTHHKANTQQNTPLLVELRHFRHELRHTALPRAEQRRGKSTPKCTCERERTERGEEREARKAQQQNTPLLVELGHLRHDLRHARLVLAEHRPEGGLVLLQREGRLLGECLGRYDRHGVPEAREIFSVFLELGRNEKVNSKQRYAQAQHWLVGDDLLLAPSDDTQTCARSHAQTQASRQRRTEKTTGEQLLSEDCVLAHTPSVQKRVDIETHPCSPAHPPTSRRHTYITHPRTHTQKLTEHALLGEDLLLGARQHALEARRVGGCFGLGCLYFLLEV